MEFQEHIKQYKIPHSAVRAIAMLNEGGDLGADEYRTRIAQLTNGTLSLPDQYARFTYLYLIQNGLKNGQADLSCAEKDAKKFIDQNPWIFAKSDSNSELRPRSAPKLDASGNPKQRKGAKKDKAIRFYNENKNQSWTRKEWIEKLVENIGLTPAGASTYYANLKAGRYK